MKIYTRTGDAGSTGLFGGPRVSKSDARICAYGSVDELNSILGLVCALDCSDELSQRLRLVQSNLFSIGAELACPEPEKFELKWAAGSSIEKMENWIDEAEKLLPPLKNFILPGGTPAAAQLHIARTVCRRVEREIVQFAAESGNGDLTDILVYLNRLSDYLFTAARYENQQNNVEDIVWVSPRS